MHLKRLLCPLLLVGGIFLAAAGLPGAEAGVEFTGWVKDDKGLLLALKSTKSGNTKWVGLGQEFEDCKVSRMDEKTEVLTVTKGGAEFQLPLIRSKVQLKDSEPEPPLAIKKQVMNNLRRLAAAADQYYLENGVSKTTYEMIVGRTNYVKEINPVDGEEYRGIVFEQGKKIQVQTKQGYNISYLP